MSIFKSKGIILKIDKIKHGEFLYTIFTKEYGKIKCNKKLSKTEKTLDLGYLINFEITTKENVSIHKIRNIKILYEFNIEKKTFNELNNYLILLSIVYNKTPNGVAIYELFQLLEIIYLSKTSELQLILLKLKIISILGELNENHSNKTISKILKFINFNQFEIILKLTGIDDNLKKELEII